MNDKKQKIKQKSKKQMDTANEVAELDNSKVKQITKSELEEILGKGRKSETEIKKLLEGFERDLRKGLEKYVRLQMKSFESRLRGEIPDFTTNKNKKISFVVISDARPEPIFGFDWEVAPDFNEADLAKSMYETLDRHIKSDEYLEIQKRTFYRLKMKGLKPAEILPLIEPYWDDMDAKTQKNLKIKFLNDYARKTEKKKVTK